MATLLSLLTPIVRAGPRHWRMARWDHRLIRLRPEEASVPVIDLTETHASGIEPNHHPRIHSHDFWRIDFDSFEMSDAAAGFAIMKGEIPTVPAVDGCGIRARLRDELRLIRTVVIGPKRSIAPAQRAVAVEHP
jgi:hypothetical protein